MSSKWKFLGAFVLGLVAYRYLLTSRPVEMVSPPPAPVTAAPVWIKPIAGSVKAKTPRAVASVPKVLKPKSRQHQVPLDLSESMITEMENSWSDLPAYAEARREERGWRMVHLDHRSQFYRAGFRDGDLVSNDTLQNQAFVDIGLVSRIERLLDRISR
jgi:hypothetical protein